VRGKKNEKDLRRGEKKQKSEGKGGEKGSMGGTTGHFSINRKFREKGKKGISRVSV